MDDPDPGPVFDPRQGIEPCGLDPSEESDLTVDVLMTHPDWRRLGAIEDEIRRLVHAVFTLLPYDVSKPLEIGIVLSSDAEVRRLNKIYRRKDTPTNVLSFPIADLDRNCLEQSCLLGEVILALETILQEADEAGIPPRDHLSHLIVHGILHLFGLDHQTETEAARMEATESNILLNLGVPDPYAAERMNAN